MEIKKFLKKSGVDYKITKHKPAFTAQRIAAAEHESGKYVAKPVIVKAGDEYLMCVLAACRKVDFKALKKQLGAKSVKLAEEKEIGKIFDDCELGAEPPFGKLYNVPTVVDKSLIQNDHILFQAGDYKKAVRMGMNDYLNLAEPKILEFSCEED